MFDLCEGWRRTLLGQWGLMGLVAVLLTEAFWQLGLKLRKRNKTFCSLSPTRYEAVVVRVVYACVNWPSRALCHDCVISFLLWRTQDLMIWAWEVSERLDKTTWWAWLWFLRSHSLLEGSISASSDSRSSCSTCSFQDVDRQPWTWIRTSISKGCPLTLLPGLSSFFRQGLQPAVPLQPTLRQELAKLWQREKEHRISWTKRSSRLPRSASAGAGCPRASAALE